MTDFSHSVVIHGHFYQPPRDDPWLESLEPQPSAAPYRDWNQRVHEECYRAVVAARIPGAGGRIDRIVNTLRSISFNFGPTLLDWMEKHAPNTYAAILEADAVSAGRNQGHGNAIAQAYHHTILPLASRRDKVTEVRWGIADFRRRFGREPAGMWLPETAVDRETLEVLAEEGIRFTIVAPHQVSPLPPLGRPGRFPTSGGRSIALFPYDGSLSHGVAFGELLRDSETWASLMRRNPGEEDGNGSKSSDAEVEKGARLVSLATDGETYGHHHRFGEMALASVLDALHRTPGVRVENFASYLARNPPQEEVDLLEPSSWSCVHGVERWRSDCGCKMAPERESQQEWRAGLREAMNWLASELHKTFEAQGRRLLGDPWAARDAYVNALAVEPPGAAAILGELAPSGLSDTEKVRAMELLEMERQALRLFTSCGWFFDDLAGIEALQVLGYAARGMELAGPATGELRAGFLARLEQARSNEVPPRSGDILFLEEVVPRTAAILRVGAAAALWRSLSPTGPPVQGVPGFQARALDAEGRFEVTHRRTGRTWVMETQVVRTRLAGFTTRVRQEGDTEEFRDVAFHDLPSGYRDAIRRVLLDQVLAPWMGESHLPAVDTILHDPPALLERALLDALSRVETMVENPGVHLEQAVERVGDLARVHGYLGLPIPFTVQTTFYRILDAASSEIIPCLADLREPLGFVPQGSIE